MSKEGEAMPGRNPAFEGTLLAIAAAVLVYFQTFLELWPRWMDTEGTTYTHGALVAAICLWLVWRSREAMRAIQPRRVNGALIAAGLASLAWLVAWRGAIVDAQTALWPILAWLLVLGAVGWRAALLVLVPIGYLYFAVPAWDYVNWILQGLTIQAVKLLNLATGVPATMYGSIVAIPQGRFAIAAGCSGLHYFMVAGAIAVLAGEIHRDRWPVRIKLVALALALALVSNWLRVYLIILAGYLTDMQHYIVRVSHYKFGWFVFALAMIIFFVYLRRIPQSEPQPVTPVPGQATQSGVPGWAWAVAVAAALPLLSLVTRTLAGPVDAAVLAPGPIAGYRGPVSPSPLWSPEFKGPAREWRVAYLAPSGRVLDYYGNAYVAQRQGAELISHGNDLFGEDFSSVARQAAPGPVVVAELESVHGTTWLAMYRYDIGGTQVGNPVLAQAVGGLKSVFAPVPAGVRAVAAPCSGDCQAERRELAALLSAMEGKQP